MRMLTMNHSIHMQAMCTYMLHTIIARCTRTRMHEAEQPKSDSGRPVQYLDIRTYSEI